MTTVRFTKNRTQYTTIQNSTIWDDRLSLEAVGLLSRLLARPDDWQIFASELCRTCKVGKYKMTALLAELTKWGYLKRTLVRKARGRIQGYEYQVFEIPEQAPMQVNKDDTVRNGNPPVPDFPAPAGPAPVNPPLLSNNSTNTLPILNPPKGAPSAAAANLASHFMDQIRKWNPGWKVKNPARWIKACDELLRIDKHTEEEVKTLINWVQNDPFWRANVLSPEKLRKKWHDLYAKKLNEHTKDGNTPVAWRTNGAPMQHKMHYQSLNRSFLKQILTKYGTKYNLPTNGLCLGPSYFEIYHNDILSMRREVGDDGFKESLISALKARNHDVSEFE